MAGDDAADRIMRWSPAHRCSRRDRACPDGDSIRVRHSGLRPRPGDPESAPISPPIVTFAVQIRRFPALGHRGGSSRRRARVNARQRRRARPCPVRHAGHAARAAEAGRRTRQHAADPRPGSSACEAGAPAPVAQHPASPPAGTSRAYAASPAVADGSSTGRCHDRQTFRARQLAGPNEAVIVGPNLPGRSRRPGRQDLQPQLWRSPIVAVSRDREPLCAPIPAGGLAGSPGSETRRGVPRADQLGLGVEVAPGQNPALMLALTAVLDQMAHEAR